MPQNNLYSTIRRFAWRIIPAAILDMLFGDKLRGMSELIESAGVVNTSTVKIPGVEQAGYQLVLENGTIVVSTYPSPNNIKITKSARDSLGFGPEFSKALVDLILRYRFPHALVPVLEISVPDAQRGGFHLQHRNLPQESEDFDETQKRFLREHFTPKTGWRIIDIGCYLGHGTTHLAQIVGASGKVLAVEAIQENAKIATFQLHVNNIQNAKILNRAVWKVAGETVPMNVTDNQANAIANDVITSSEKIHIQTTSIAELTQMLGQAADLITLTVNGAEVEALDALENMSTEMRPKRLVMPGWYPSDDSPRSEILKTKLNKFGYETLITKHQFVIAWRTDSQSRVSVT